MSFWTGFGTGLAKSVDQGLQKAMSKRDDELSRAKTFWQTRQAQKLDQKEAYDARAEKALRRLIRETGSSTLGLAAFNAAGGDADGAEDFLKEVDATRKQGLKYDIRANLQLPEGFEIGEDISKEKAFSQVRQQLKGVDKERIDIADPLKGTMFALKGGAEEVASQTNKMFTPTAAPDPVTGLPTATFDRSGLITAKEYQEKQVDRQMKLDRFEMDKSAFKQNQSKVTQAMQLAREAEDRLKLDQDNGILQQEYQNAVDAADRFKRYAQLDREAEMFILKKEAAELGIEVTQLQLDKDRKPPEFTDFEKMAVYYTQKLGERGITTEQKNDYAEGLRRAVEGASKWNAATVKKDGKSKFFSNESRQSILNGEIKRQLEPFGMVDDLGQVIAEEIDGTDQPKYFDSMRRALDNVTAQVSGLNDPSMTALIDGQRSSLRVKMNEYKKAAPDEQQKTARDIDETKSATFKETLKPGDVVTYETANGGTATRIWTGDRYI